MLKKKSRATPPPGGGVAISRFRKAIKIVYYLFKLINSVDGVKCTIGF